MCLADLQIMAVISHEKMHKVEELQGFIHTDILYCVIQKGASLLWTGDTEAL